jgi:hypothetical protein
MGSTHNGSPSQTGATPQRSLFENVGQAPVQNDAERGLSADPNMPLQIEPVKPPDHGDSQRPVLVPPEPADPIWVQRLKLVIFVLFSVELGMLLVVLPWTPVWTHNSLVISSPDLRDILHHYFTRGAVTGLGLVDMWIGIWSAVQYREKK